MYYVESRKNAINIKIFNKKPDLHFQRFLHKNNNLYAF